MYKVLIVDDEISIREGLPLVIDWQEYEYEVVATASNGNDGLKKIIDYQPDLVITDIEMPGKNGLEMIEDAKKAKYDFFSIILSGYSEFQYAQKAIRLGASSYLLKPVDEEELISLLESITQQTNHNAWQGDTSQLMEKMFGGDDTGIPNSKYAKAIRVHEDLDVSIIKQALAKYCDQIYPFIHRYNQYIVITNQDPFNEKQLASALVSAMPNKEILLSRTIICTESLKTLAIDIQSLNKLTFLLPNQLISQEIFDKRKEEKNSRKTVLAEVVDAIVHDSDLERQLESYRNLYFSNLSLEDEIKWQINKDMESIIHQIFQLNTIRIDWEEDLFRQEIYLMQNFDDLFLYFKSCLLKLKETILVETGNTNIIDRITEYINQNYQEELSLKKIGELFNYNKSYLGKKFRRQTGQTFLAFLEEVRLKKAADILENSNLMVYEVANMVGYSNVDYFYKKFKAFYHVSPNEYRRKVDTKKTELNNEETFH